MRESISISLPGTLRQELDRLSKSEGASRSDVIREALSEYIFIRRFRDLRQRLIPYAEAQGVTTDEDVFREVS